MDGLIIKPEWLSLIISGVKSLEIRGRSTTKIGEPFYLLESGTHRVRGIYKIKSVKPIDDGEWVNLKDKHCVYISYSEITKRYPKVYGWGLECVEVFDEILYYKHPAGAVVWVKDVELYSPDDFNERIRYGY